MFPHLKTNNQLLKQFDSNTIMFLSASVRKKPLLVLGSLPVGQSVRHVYITNAKNVIMKFDFTIACIVLIIETSSLWYPLNPSLELCTENVNWKDVHLVRLEVV